jgi:hypothetical protein
MALPDKSSVVSAFGFTIPLPDQGEVRWGLSESDCKEALVTQHRVATGFSL